jgi:hypothetical protein
MLKIKITKNTLTPFVGEVLKRISNPIKLWPRIDKRMHEIVTLMFANKGGRYERPKWRDIAPSMANRIRRGSDGTIRGRYRDGMTRPLRASGIYRRSFGQISKPRPTFMVWGSKHPLAAVIPHAGLGDRYVLPHASSPEFADMRVEEARAWLQEDVLAPARLAARDAIDRLHTKGAA